VIWKAFKKYNEGSWRHASALGPERVLEGLLLPPPPPPPPPPPDVLEGNFLLPCWEKEIEDLSGASVTVSQRDELYPGTLLMILRMQQETIEVVNAALGLIVYKIKECGDQETEREPQRFLIAPGEYIFRVATPSVMRGAIVGPGDREVEHICQRRNAKRHIHDEVFLGHLQMDVGGSVEGLRTAISMINEAIWGGDAAHLCVCVCVCVCVALSQCV
jgi:hypothetical protein